MGQAYKELLPIDKKVDRYVDLLRREELNERDCGRDIEK
jgi:hypothetical protein